MVEPPPGLSFLHLSGERRGSVDCPRHVPATLGSAAEDDVQVPGCARRHALVRREEDRVVLLDLGSTRGTFVAGEEVTETALRSGDVIQLGKDGPRLRFRDECQPPATLVQALRWTQPDGIRAADAGPLIRALLHESAARTSRSFRLTLAVVAVAGAAGLYLSHRETQRLEGEVALLQRSLDAVRQEREAFFARIEAERRRAEADRLAFEAALRDSRRREAELEARVAEARSEEVADLHAELGAARSRLAALEEERAVAERIIRDYGAGVCLIQGAFAFYDAQLRPLRLTLDEQGQPVGAGPAGLSLTAEGQGPIYRVDYFGTGFLVDRRGLLLTNRHVAEPWWRNAFADGLAARGLRPRLLVFRAFFPREPEPFELEILRHADGTDLSLAEIELRGRRIPALPLDPGPRAAVAGQPVVVVGYPTGLEAILGKAEAAVVREILEGSGQSAERVAEALARKGLIRPSTTQGHIGDVTKSDVIFDAPTTHGGSGGPVFNRSGRVVAIEYAVLEGFGGHSFGVPARFAQQLLRERR
ncbi:MAG TPA: trypsin-like peptidase domain-containing protein [Vicinamibacteria bacterium]|nr:trypsin-like peptidase domain-containing protein [Vicinamibacteria bacterium]